MERVIKYLMYRGIRYASNLISKKANFVQELTYRGAKTIVDSTSKAILHSSAQKMYRGAAF